MSWKIGTKMPNGETRYVNNTNGGPVYVYVRDGRIVRTTPLVALRAGVWLDPDHQMRATLDDPYEHALLPRGKDEWHYSAGVGLAMDRFQVDLALDVSDRLNTVSLSAIYNF